MSLNRVTFIANLTKDPETRTAASGQTITRMRVAISRPRRNGEDQGAEYVDVDAFGVIAESCGRYLSKGRRIAVDGRLHHSEWDHEGTHHQRLGVIANTVDFLDPGSTTSTETSEPADLADAPAAA